MPPVTLGPFHMSANRQYEVQRSFNFEVVLEGFSEDFTLAVTSCPLPTVMSEVIELSYGNSKVKVAGQYNVEDISIVVKDFILADLEKQMWAWRSQVANTSTGAIGWAEDYKKSGRIYQYGPDGTHVRSWKIKGAWPTSFDSTDFSYDGSDKKEITMNLSIDYAYPE